MLITSEDVAREPRRRYLKKTFIPFTCRPFQESEIQPLVVVARSMRLQRDTNRSLSPDISLVVSSFLPSPSSSFIQLTLFVRRIQDLKEMKFDEIYIP